MSGFGYIYTFYLMIVALEIWFVFRPDIVRMAQGEHRADEGYSTQCCALGVFDVSEKALHLDHKITTVLAAIGIPSACMLHGYVGFLFGSLKSNPWWSTPLMPVIFLMSAIVSGIAVLIVSYAMVMKLRGKTVDTGCMQSLYSYLWGFFIVDVTLELLELLTMAYEGEESWAAHFPAHRRQAAVQLCYSADYHLLYHSAGAARLCFSLEAQRIHAQYAGPYLIVADADTGACHALECGYRRAAVFKEPAGAHQLYADISSAARACWWRLFCLPCRLWSCTL